MFINLKGTFSQKPFLDYHFKWWIRSKLRYANTFFKFFKSPIALLRFFKRAGSRFKMGSGDLHLLAAHSVDLLPSRCTASNVHYDPKIVLKEIYMMIGI
jgi:hypothetical protein